MATNILDAFVVTFGLDGSKFKSGAREIDEQQERLNERNKRAFSDMEKRGESLASSLKSVRNEVIGLGLAFLGATSITGFVSNMITGAASADRMGKTMAMSTRQVWAWRMAMQSVGGSAGDADSSLMAIARAKQSYRLGQMDPTQQAIYGRLGITAGDLSNSNPGQILEKLSAAADRMDPQLFANLLQQIGMSGPTVYFLQQGQRSVDQLLRTMENSSKGQDELAKQSEELQKQLAQLKATFERSLIPDILALVTALNKIVALFDKLTGSFFDPDSKGYSNAWDYLGDAIGGSVGDWMHKHMGARGGEAPAAGGSGAAAGGKRGTLADRNRNPGNIRDGDFARGQAGYIGSEGGFAKFDSIEHGAAAMFKLLMSYVARGRDTIAAIISRWAPSSENNTAAYIRDVERRTGIGRFQHLTNQQLAIVAGAMARHEGYSGGALNVQHMTVHTQAQDGHAMVRDVRAAASRRRTVAQADRGVAP